MQETYEPLGTNTLENLMTKEFEDRPHLVDTLLPGVGLFLMAGDPKCGKSLLALDIALHVAAGVPLWNHDVTMTEVLYLCLEDKESRLQERVLKNGSVIPSGFYYANSSLSLRGELMRQLEEEKKNHPGIGFVVIDTLAAIKGQAIGIASIYQDDYNVLRPLHDFSTKYNITILLLHHTNKCKYSSPMYNISGSNGLTGASDGNFLLEKEHFWDLEAKLYCSCRDYEQHVLTLRFDKATCRWDCVNDTSTFMDSLEIDPDIWKIVEYIREKKEFRGSTTELLKTLGIERPAHIISGLLYRKRLDLERVGIMFDRNRDHDGRVITLLLIEPSGEVPVPERMVEDA